MLTMKIVHKRVPDLRVLLLYRELHKSYYDSLGLTPKASQGDIKKAFYKMSMLYHPDKEDGNAERFKEISTAYEVLVNNKLRKLYDKGLLPTGAAKFAAAQESKSTETQQDPEPSSEPRQSHFYENARRTSFDETTTKKKKVYTGKTEHFDYDAWTQNHYSETFTRQETRKAKFTKKKEISKQIEQVDKAATLFFIFSVCGLLYCYSELMSNDKPSKRRID